MNIIFLDFDGVINNSKCWTPEAHWRQEDVQGRIRIPTAPECIERLNRLVDETCAYVVISSSWRLFADWKCLGPSLAQYGFRGRVIGETPDLANDPVWLDAWRNREGAPFHYERLERGMEIKEWLLRHRDPFAFKERIMNQDVCSLCYGCDIDTPLAPACSGHVVHKFVVLDDCNDMTDVKDQFVWTDPEIGLDDPDVERAKHLMEKSQQYMIDLHKEGVCYGP